MAKRQWKQMTRCLRLSAQELTRRGRPTKGNEGIQKIHEKIVAIFPDWSSMKKRDAIVSFAKLAVIQSVPQPRKRSWKQIQKERDAFYASREWMTLRYEVLKEFGARCLVCGRTARDGIKIHVDHIKPRSLFPELELAKENLQVLCEDCNKGKSNRDDIDWRSYLPERTQ